MKISEEIYSALVLVAAATCALALFLFSIGLLSKPIDYVQVSIVIFFGTLLATLVVTTGINLKKESLEPVPTTLQAVALLPLVVTIPLAVFGIFLLRKRRIISKRLSTNTSLSATDQKDESELKRQHTELTSPTRSRKKKHKRAPVCNTLALIILPLFYMGGVHYMDSQDMTGFFGGIHVLVFLCIIVLSIAFSFVLTIVSFVRKEKFILLTITVFTAHLLLIGKLYVSMLYVW